MTVDKVAEELGISTERVRKYCQRGELGNKLGRQWIITREQLEAFKATRRKAGRPRKE